MLEERTFAMRPDGLFGPKRKSVLRILVRWIAVLCVVALVAGIWLFINIQPVRAKGTAVLDIQKGDTLGQVATMLQSKGIIKNALVFRAYSHFATPALSVKAGHYILAKGTSFGELLHELHMGQSSWDTVMVTIPEGFTVKQIAMRLQAEGVCSEQSFLEAEQHGSFDEPFLKNIGQSPQVKYRLEGYLFPDTYDFTKNESAHEVIDDMLRNFLRHVDANLVHEMNNKGITLQQTITEASLIEKEARVNSERKLIASVINNRLTAKPSMKLQIDATIEYILGHQNVVTDADLHVNDPYNTYLYPGLPPGPIANPGLASIDAVLQPAKTNYYYYVVKNNGSGEHYFAHTYAQQLKNETMSQKNLTQASHS
jgi:UPF0755 protein